MDQFPPNSKKAAERPKHIERVTSVDPVRRKRPLRKQFSETLFGGDAHSAGQYMVFDVLIPAAKDALVEAFSSGFEKMVFGDTKRRRGAPARSSAHPTERVQYNRMYTPEPPPERKMSRHSRARHNFDEIVLNSRSEADEVLERMYDLLSRFDSVTVADLYDLTGIPSSHTDFKWGWNHLSGAGIQRVRTGGYLLNLPDPEPLG